jgi:ATP-binding cassette, subfamily B, bacterial PglK
MINIIRELFSQLTLNQRKSFLILQSLVIVMSIFELIGIASIIPFMSLVSDINLLETNEFYKSLFLYSGASSINEFIVYSGVCVLLLLSSSSLVSVLTVWRLSLFANQVGVEIADDLYKYYMSQSWLFHCNNSSAEFTKKIANESLRITGGILQPLMQMNAKIVLAFLLIVSLIIYNPKVAFIGVLIFLITYIIIFNFVKVKLKKNGSDISNRMTQRYRLMNEGFGGIKDILLLGRPQEFINSFQESGKSLAYSQGSNAALSLIPRYLIELVAFGSIISLIIFLVLNDENNINSILPILSLYALAGFKLLPAFQQIYSSISQVKGNISAFESVKIDMETSKNCLDFNIINNSINAITPKNAITLKGLSFHYPNKSNLAIDNITLSIPANSVIGIVGSSGSGKSTLIDILIGLIEPKKGELLIDNIKIDSNNKREWQNSIGLVPQSIFLTEGSISENIAFGINPALINKKQIERVIKLAHLNILIDELPQGVDTKVGERGVQLSGGQRQRIGIARALYHEASILVFDEATSALDGITENLIMGAINEFHGKKTIIMVAHRLKTVQKCDVIYFLDKGQVIDHGTFDELLERNTLFKNMVKYS